MSKSLERSVQKRAKREQIQHKLGLILARFTAQSGRLMFAPEAVLVRRLQLKGTERWKPTYQLRQSVQQLQKKGLVEFQKGPQGWAVRLTQKGERWAREFDIQDKLAEKPPKWDGRWRVVIFDIWESRRGMRDKLRRMLTKAGFYKIQNSVWAYPYDCADLLVFLRADMQLGKSILYIIADGIENDAKIKQHFNLV